MPSDTALNSRRHDLDWLRIIAFAILIFYHIGMFYVTWGWHVKSPHANEHPEILMLLANPWRLALLFFISGVALRFLSDKLGAGGFARERAARLLPVMVFGMAVVVAPQTYFELRQAGDIGADVASFYGEYIRPSELHGLITPTWNHLWYVAYLLVYSLLLAPFLPLLRRLAARLDALKGRAGPAAVLAVMLLPVLPFILYRLTLDPHFPTTHNLFWDWANHAHRFTILLIGYFVAKNPGFWAAAGRALPFAAVYALGFGALYVWAVENFHLIEGRDEILWPIRMGRILFAWCVILTLLGLARRFLNRSGPALRYLNEAIFPYFILHQTITVTAGYYLAQMSLNVWMEFAALSAITIGGCALLHEFVIRRSRILRPLFGLKALPSPDRAASAPQGRRGLSSP